MGAALTSGCDGIETDIQMTRDRIPVLYHDRTLHKINGSLKRVSEFDFEQLQKLDWGGGFRLRLIMNRFFPWLNCFGTMHPAPACFLKSNPERSTDGPGTACS